jgi:hypothetical protein
MNYLKKNKTVQFSKKMSDQKLKSAKIESRSCIIIESITSDSLQIKIGYDLDFSEVKNILKDNPKIYILKFQFEIWFSQLTWEDERIDIYQSFIKLIEKFNQITQLEIIIKEYDVFETLKYLKKYSNFSNVKSIILLFDSVPEESRNKIYKFISNLTSIHHLTIKKTQKTSLRDSLKLFKILLILNTLPNLKSFHTFDFCFHDDDGHTMQCKNLLRKNKTMIDINISQLDPLPKEISERNYKRCKDNLISILSSREYEDSLFHRDYLPLDMVKVILYTTDLMNLFKTK